MPLRVDGYQEGGPGSLTVVVGGDSFAEIQDEHACRKLAASHVGATFPDPRITNNQVQFVRPDGTVLGTTTTLDDLQHARPRRLITFVNGAPLRPPGAF